MTDATHASTKRLILEMLVVVVSILIAFSLDAWWEGRAEARTETAHLRAIRSDFEQNVARLSARVDRQQQIADASRRLLVAISSETPPVRDSVGTLLSQVFSSGRFVPVMGAYEAVISSGGLAQVRDDSLRLALADFASLLEGRYYERYADELYVDFIRSFTGRLGMAAAVVATDSLAAAQAAVVLQSGLLADPGFHERLALRHLAERDVAGTYRELLVKAQHVLKLTDRALE